MPPSWQRLLGGTKCADVKVSARTTRGAVKSDFWERSVSFVHSYDPTVVMGFHSCSAAMGGTGKNIFSAVFPDAPAVAIKTIPEMFPSVPFRGIPTTLVLLPPSFPPTIHLR